MYDVYVLKADKSINNCLLFAKLKMTRGVTRGVMRKFDITRTPQKTPPLRSTVSTCKSQRYLVLVVHSLLTVRTTWLKQFAFLHLLKAPCNALSRFCS